MGRERPLGVLAVDLVALAAVAGEKAEESHGRAPCEAKPGSVGSTECKAIAVPARRARQ